VIGSGPAGQRGNGLFCRTRHLRLEYVDGTSSRTVKASKIVIAAGAETTRAPHIPFNGDRIFTSDDVLELDRLPRTLAVAGAGVIGCEYASIFAAPGVRVTLIDKRHRLLPFVDQEIADEFCHHLRENRATLRLNESVGKLEIVEDEHGARVRIHLDSGKTAIAEKALYSVGRTGAATSSIWQRRASSPTIGAGWRSTSIIKPRSPTSTRSAT
jgi:pyruvate/2-oxoglutarate dehydrogenase complex dihydrolipoamide dehydrogenase (E3) component